MDFCASPSDSCFGRALMLGDAIRAFALARGASAADALKARRIAVAMFPLIFFKVDDEQIEATPEALCTFASFFDPGGSAARALRRSDLPSELRSAVCYVLFPFLHQDVAVWWHQVARPRWVEPFFAHADSQAALKRVLADDVEVADWPKAIALWNRALYAPWPKLTPSVGNHPHAT